MIYLTTTERVKAVTGIGGNVSDEWLLPVLGEVQELHLRPIIGDGMLAALYAAVEARESGTAATDMIDRLQPWLAYECAALAAVPITVKTGNIGVHLNADDKISAGGMDMAVRVEGWWRHRADAALYDFERWLLKNYDKYKDKISAGGYRQMRARLHSAASGGLWLGGKRGY